MKILLVAINAKYIHSNLAIYDLRAYSKKYGEHIEIAEYTINNLSEQIIIDIYKRNPDVIAFSTYIWNVDMVNEIAREINKLMPDVPIWAGGPEVSYCAEEYLTENPYFSGIMYGEGEETFKMLVEYYLGIRPDISQVTGITYRKDNAIITAESSPQIDMDDIPFPYEDIDGLENRIIYYESSRGCPFSCSYCLSSVDKHLRFRSVDIVKKELEFFLKMKVPQIKFVDRTFNCKKKHAMDIWQFILDNDNGVTNFHFEIGADLIDADELELLSKMRKGLIQLEIGIQSTNDDTIKEIHRVMDFGKLSGVVRKIKSFGNIHQHVDLIAGLPYENLESFIKSFNDVYALHAEQLQLGFLKVLKGSYMQEMQKKYGIIHKDKAPYEVMYTNWLSFSEVLELKQIEEMVETFYNSGQFSNTIDLLEHFYETPYMLYKDLANYYDKHIKAGMKQNRIAKYELIHDMYCEKLDSIKNNKNEIYNRFDDFDMQLLDDMLVYDIFDRENAKSRPGFSFVLEEDREKIKRFYRDEGRKYDKRMTHIEAFSYERVADSDGQNSSTSKGFYKNNEINDILETENMQMGCYIKQKNFVLFDYETGDRIVLHL